MSLFIIHESYCDACYLAAVRANSKEEACAMAKKLSRNYPYISIGNVYEVIENFNGLIEIGEEKIDE